MQSAGENRAILALGPETADAASSLSLPAAVLRARARHIRQQARNFADDEAGERMLAYARELEQRAARLEAGG